MRKVIVISGIVILVAAAAFLGVKYFPGKPHQPAIQTFSTKQNPAFKAVPQKSPLVIEVKNQEGFFNALKGDNPVFAELRGIPEVESLLSNISRFKDFISSRSGTSKLLKGKSIIISVNPTGKNQLTNLFLVQLNDKNESNSAAEVVSRELGGAYTIARKSYDNTTVFSAKSTELSFYFTCTNDIFIASEDFILIEQSIRQTNSQNLLNNPEFTEVYKTIEETALANIFINHQTIHQVLAKLVSPEIRKTISQIASYSNWSELDLSVNASELELKGYSVTKDSTDNYLNIFLNQEAQKMTIEEAIPANASYFIALNLKNTSNFIDQNESYLRANGNYYPREMSLIEFRKKTNTDPVKLIKELSGTQFAGVYTNINKSNPTQNRFFIAELIDHSDAREKLSKAVTEFGKTSRMGVDKLLTQYAAAGKKSFDIYRLPIANMAESLFGRAFSGINAEYFVLYEKYLICGDNLPGLKNYLLSLVSEKTLANDSTYLAYSKAGQTKPNFYLYTKIPKVFRLKDVLLKPEISNLLSENEDIFRKFSTFSWQFSVSDQMIKNHIRLKYDPNVKEEPQAVWQLKLEGQLAQRPKFGFNHKDLPNREVIVCDKQNNISLINKEGLVLWTMNIPGEIVSEIHQVDIYQTKRFQYLFNTKTQLYLIDRMGNNVRKFPVTLRSIASNGISVAEFGKNKEYRFFIAGEDKKIYAFDRDGKLVPKWNFEGTESLVTKPIQHFEIDGKDYIVFSDKRNTYFLDRQGKSRDIQSAQFDHSNNPMYMANDVNPKLISTDQSGKIHIQDFSGQTELIEPGKFGAGHRFAAEDLDGNGSPEYLFAEGKKLSVFALDGKKLFDRTFPDNISETPFVCSFGPGINKIGVVVGNENKIYLLEKNGSITRGFPLDGNTSFILEKFNDANGWYNLIVGGEGNTLVNYRIE
ncbi:MAG: WD40 repeat domain-containing protein [Bacteroidota bacterium]|nr:WD40 repeat domain-containing protein [Bacteroidota bacterium]